MTSEASHLTIAFVGHVDHGKSTLVGRLLADTGSLPDGKLAAVAAHCERARQPFEYAFLVDALRDERAQGITIDAARIPFHSGGREYQIIDVPGHVEFVKNMITGAARADAALLVVDAREGVRENTRRHAYLLAALGLPQIAVLVNKMDLVEYEQSRFEQLATELTALLHAQGMQPAGIVPVSGAAGDNVVQAAATMRWYNGPTVMNILERFEPEPRASDAPFRMPVQDVYRRSSSGTLRRVLAGTVVTGSASVGDEIVLYPSGKRSRLAAVEQYPAAGTHAAAGQAVGLALEDQLYVRRGELAARADEQPPLVASRIRAAIFWLSPTPLVPGKDVILKLGTGRVTARLERVERLIDTGDDAALDRATSVACNQAAECVLQLDRPIALDEAHVLGATSRFVLVDDHAIRGGGTVCAVLPTESVQDGAAMGARGEGAVIWLTGLSGAGKSTIAAWLERELTRQGHRVERLDGDTIRGIFPNVGFSRAERDSHIRRVGHLASRLEHHGVVVIASFISPYGAARSFVRGLCSRFLEVHVATPVEECARRDPKGLYARARAGSLQHFTGVDDAYEPPAAPELVLDTSGITVEEAGSAVLDMFAAARRGVQ